MGGTGEDSRHRRATSHKEHNTLYFLCCVRIWLHVGISQGLRYNQNHTFQKYVQLPTGSIIALTDRVQLVGWNLVRARDDTV